jgi:kynurenine formamidase
MAKWPKQRGNRLFKQIIDLTHSLNPQVPTWDGSCGFELDGEQITIQTSAGTHIDMPAYFSEKGFTAATLPLSRLVVPAHVIDLSKTAKADTIISPEEIHRYEAVHGLIGKNSLVICYTGWSRHWPDAKAYRNEMHFPTFGRAAIELLLNRDIAGVAIDTLALERSDGDYPCHKLLMDAGKYIIENIANASKLPSKGAYVAALPLKIENGVEAPARVIALLF